MLRKMTFCLLARVYCHKITSYTPLSGYHGVTNVTCHADVGKLVKHCINCISVRPTPLTQTLWIPDPKILFQLKIEKKPKDS